MELTVRTDLSKADMGKVMACAGEIFLVLCAIASSLEDLPPQNRIADQEEMETAINHALSMVTVNIACLWYTYPSVRTCWNCFDSTTADTTIQGSFVHIIADAHKRSL